MDAKLVNIIVQRVVEALQAQGQGSSRPAAGQTAPAKPAKAAAVVKRQALVVREHTAGGNAILEVPGRENKKTQSKPPAPAKMFVTADLLAQRATGSTNGAIELARNEHLTPAAEDLLEKKHWTVTRSNGAASAAASILAAAGRPNSGADAGAKSPAKLSGSVRSPAGDLAGALGLVVVKASDKTGALLSALEREGVKTACFCQSDCCMCNIESLCSALAAGQVEAGVVLSPFAAEVMLLASKCKGVLPVQGTRVDSVAAAVRHYGANLLVLEHAVATFHEMRQMIRTFAAPRSEPNFKDLLDRVAKREGRA